MIDLRDQDLKSAEITIVSGEGAGCGNFEKYSGRLTIRAIKQRIKKETSGGDRWAYSEIAIDGSSYKMDQKGDINV